MSATSLSQIQQCMGNLGYAETSYESKDRQPGVKTAQKHGDAPNSHPSIPNSPVLEVEMILTFVSHEKFAEPEQQFQMRVFGCLLCLIVAQVRDH